MKYVNLLVTLYQFNHIARNGNCKQKGCSCACKNICLCTLIFFFAQGFIEFYKRMLCSVARVSDFQRWNLSGRDVLLYRYICVGMAAGYTAFIKTCRLSEA